MKNRRKSHPDGNDFSNPSTTVQLARHLGVFDATMIGVGAMIGAGIFVLTGIAMGLAGPAAILAFALNGIVTLFTALSYAELASAIPEAGGGYSYIKKMMPNAVAFASGWMLWFAYIVACSLYAKAFGSYFLEFFERQLPAATHKVIGLLGHQVSVAIVTLLIGLFFITINIIGTHASGKAENVVTIAKLVVLGMFIFFGYRQFFIAPNTAFKNFSPLLPNGFTGILAAMGLTFIAFEGYDLIATVSEEVKDPKRTIPRAILLSLGITMVVYLSVVFVSLAAVPPAEGLPTWKLLGKYGETGIIRAAEGFMPTFGIFLILVGGLFATLSALNATILASSRVAFSMGRDWMLPNRLSQIHPARKTPVMAVSITGFIFLTVAIFLPIEILGSCSSLLFLLTFSLVNLALIMYRIRHKGEPPPFRVPLFPLTPILGIGTCLALSLYQLWNEPLAWVLAAGWIVVGIGIYLVAFSRRVTIADVPKVIESPELLGLKKIKNYKVLLPLANPERIESLVDMAGKISNISQGEVMALSIIDLPNITTYTEVDELLKEPQYVLNKAQQLALNRKITFSSLLKIGRSTAPEIVQVALENRCNLILMGYKKDEDPLENSVIHHVIAHQPCDIAILKSDRGYLGTFERILVPIGGKDVNDSLKVRFVHGIYRSSGCKVTLMTVIPVGAVRIQRKRAYESLQRAAKIYNIPSAELLMEESVQVATAIISQSKERDLLILGLREEPWLQSFFFGTIAQQVAGQVTCPKLLVKQRSGERSGFKYLLRVGKKQR
jgi:amino acid transporter/nucleotide-binding universal stress UspA family protein